MSTFKDELVKKGYLTYTCKGVSMRPLIRQNKDVVVIVRKEPDVRCKKYDSVLYLCPDGRYILHRILKVLPDGYYIVGDNNTVGEKVTEQQVIGILKEIKRGGRLIKVTDFDYLAYVYLWCAPYPLRFLILRMIRFMRRCAKFLVFHILRVKRYERNSK